MTDFVSTWNNDLLTVPFAPLGLIAMPGCEELGQKVNNWLMKWYEQQEALEDTPLFSLMGANRHDFLIEAHCPRFGTGEGKGMIKNSVRGYDIYILTDIGAYNVTYKMYGREVPMSPDDHYQDLKRIIAAIGGRAQARQRHHAHALRGPSAPPYQPRKPGLRPGAAGAGADGREQHHHLRCARPARAERRPPDRL